MRLAQALPCAGHARPSAVATSANATRGAAHDTAPLPATETCCSSCCRRSPSTWCLPCYPLHQLGRPELLRLRRRGGRLLRRPRQLRATCSPTRPSSERFWNALLQQRGVLRHPPRRRAADRPAAWRRCSPRACCARSRGVYRTLLFIPATLSVVIVGFIWRLIINPLWGLVELPAAGNEIDGAADDLAHVGLAVHRHPDDLPVHARSSRSPTTSSRPPRIDGAGGWSTFWQIKFPLIAPQFGLIAILTYIWTFNGFDIVYALNGSAPGPELLDRHPRHAVLPHLLRVERTGRRRRPRRRRSRP